MTFKPVSRTPLSLPGKSAKPTPTAIARYGGDNSETLRMRLDLMQRLDLAGLPE
jgi:hypothetical protein